MQKTGKIKVGLSCFVVALILAFFIPAAMFPAETKAVCSAMYSFITKDLACMDVYVWGAGMPSRNSRISSIFP